MGRNYESIRTEDFLQSAEEFSAIVEKLVSKTLDEIELNKEKQLDRIEKKLDRLLNILENGELSVSLDSKEIDKNLFYSDFELSTYKRKWKVKSKKD